MSKTRLIVLACFVAAFGAGIALGWTLHRFRPRRPPGHPGSWIEQELNLTAKQREQMREIWSEAMRAAREQGRVKRDAARKARDEAIQQLLTEEQKAAYADILRRYAENSESLDKEARQVFDAAVERTKPILTEPQRKKYEEMLARRGGWGPPRRGRPPGDGYGPGSGPDAPPPGPPPPQGEE